MKYVEFVAFRSDGVICSTWNNQETLAFWSLDCKICGPRDGWICSSHNFTHSRSTVILIVSLFWHLIIVHTFSKNLVPHNHSTPKQALYCMRCTLLSRQTRHDGVIQPVSVITPKKCISVSLCMLLPSSPRDWQDTGAMTVQKSKFLVGHCWRP